MALNSTMFRFEITVSDVDRGVYETLSLRVAMHPSESVPYLLTRIIAYALNYQAGIEFTGGIATPDEPAIWVKDLTGGTLLWIEIGNPSARRLHKASKAAKTVRIYGHRDPKILMDEIKGQEIYRSETIELFTLSSALLNSLGATLERDNDWELLHTGGEISITVGGATFSGEVVSRTLST